MREAGTERLSDIGEASVAYLTTEAFVAMAEMASRQKTPLADALRREIVGGPFGRRLAGIGI